MLVRPHRRTKRFHRRIERVDEEDVNEVIKQLSKGDQTPTLHALLAPWLVIQFRSYFSVLLAQSIDLCLVSFVTILLKALITILWLVCLSSLSCALSSLYFRHARTNLSALSNVSSASSEFSLDNHLDMRNCRLNEIPMEIKA